MAKTEWFADGNTLTIPEEGDSPVLEVPVKPEEEVEISNQE